MHYIYDILANFNDLYYDFYEWNDDDNIIHIKKIPIIKVDSDFFNSVKFFDVVVDHFLLEKIYRKTDFFNINKDKYCYVCCLCDGKQAFIVNFDSKGIILGRSSMLIDEENEVIDISECINISKFDIVVGNSIIDSFFKTRNEISINKIILDKLDFLSYDELCYLYFDCFDECESDVDNIVQRIKNELDSNFNYVFSKIDDFFSLISINK